MKNSYKIIGGQPLIGEVTVSGSKNASLPIMSASLLVDGPITLHNVPYVEDVSVLSQLLETLGVDVYRGVGRKPQAELFLQTEDHRPHRAAYRIVQKMRASFCVLGPLLARRGRAMVSLPGGCNLGSRPVDLHLKGFSAMGAEIRIHRGYVYAKAKKLHGAVIDLLGPRGTSVTATANVLCAATLARGKTLIQHAAYEPEVIQLGLFLNQMGAKIVGIGSSTLEIEGVEYLQGTEFTIPGDRIEAATWLIAAAITCGQVTVRGIDSSQSEAVIHTLRQIGCTIKEQPDRITLLAPQKLLPVDIIAQPYPGLPTDTQAMFVSLLAITEGKSSVQDHVFPSRFTQLDEMIRLGANVELSKNRLSIYGQKKLSGGIVTAPDLRAGAALVIAALAATGETIVRQASHIDRGYQHLAEKLRSLGANIQRTTVSSSSEEFLKLSIRKVAKA